MLKHKTRHVLKGLKMADVTKITESASSSGPSLCTCTCVKLEAWHNKILILDQHYLNGIKTIRLYNVDILRKFKMFEFPAMDTLACKNKTSLGDQSLLRYSTHQERQIQTS